MRAIVRAQLPLVASIEHPLARELSQVSALIDALPPEAIKAVYTDIVNAGGDPDKGREGLSADQVIRVMVVKQMTQSSYDELAFHLLDSVTFRAFCRLGMADEVAKSTLQKNIKCVTPETWEQVNRLLVGHGKDHRIETGEKTRTDCSVVETNIHEPSDSSLLWDSVRVLSRLMDQAREAFGNKFNRHTRRARRRALGILNAKRTEDREKLYRDLIAVTQWVVADARRVAAELKEEGGFEATAIGLDLAHYLPLVDRVIDQTTRRVLHGESVPAGDKIVSIFEPHTDIIIKDRRETYYGHKVCFTTGLSGMVLDLVVESGNPADSTLASKMVARVKDIFAKAPRQAAFDGGFSSRSNIADIKLLGVEDVVFSKHVGLAIEDMASSKRVFKELRNFRAGIEAGISWLKRVFGLTRCTWKGHTAFKAYVWASTVAFNLLVLARKRLAAA